MLAGCAAVALLLLTVAVVSSVLSFDASLSEVSRPLARLAFLGVFVVWFAVVLGSGLASAEVRDGRSWRSAMNFSRDDRQWRESLPGSVLAAVGVCLVVLVFCAVVGIGGLRSGPEQVGDRYYSNDHGEITELTEAEFDEAVAAETRLMSAFAGALLSAGAVMAATRRNGLVNGTKHVAA